MQVSEKKENSFKNRASAGLHLKHDIWLSCILALAAVPDVCNATPLGSS